MISEGRHPARATDLQFGKTETGKDQIAITFEIVEGPERGELITYFGYLTEDAAKHAFKALAVCGAPKGKKLEELAVDDLPSLVSLVVENETYKGKTSAKVQWVNRPGQGGFKLKHTVEGAELRQLSTKWSAAWDQTERYEPIPVPERSAEELPPREEKKGGDHPFAPGNGQEDIPF